MKCRILKKLNEWFNGPVILDKYVYMTKMEFGDMKRMYHNKQDTHLVFREDYRDRWLVDFVDSDTRNEYGDKVITVGWCGEYNGKKGIFYFNDEFTKRAKIIPEKEILCVE